MAPVTPVYPSLQVDRVDLYQGDRRQQSQFKNGALLKGQITGRQGNQFVLEVDGQQWIARSRTPLRVGQNLNLQVTGTKPAVTLQILADPLTSQVGKSIHLLTGEGELVSKTLELASLLPKENLSPPTRQTLAFYQNSTGLLTGADQAASSRTNELANQLSTLLQQVLRSDSTVDQQELHANLQELLRNLPDKGAAADLGKTLLAELNSAAGKNSLTTLLFSSGNAGKSAQQIDILLQQLASGGTAGQSLAEALINFTSNQQELELAPTPFLLRLFDLVGKLTTETDSQAQAPAQGKELKEYIDRVGTNMERLLAEGKTDQAATTLKSALLEISQQHDVHASVASQAGHLSSTIEAIQLLQVRLAQDAIFLLPLPFSFLDQGFLVIDQDRSGKQKEPGQTDLPARYSLYLQLEGLGNLRIDFQQTASGTRLYFYAQDADRARFLSRNQEELLSLLTATVPESIQFLTGAEDPVKSLLGKITDTGSAVLNTTA